MSFNSLEEIYIKLDYDKYTLEKYKYLEAYILELFNNHSIITDSSDSNIYCWNGVYYEEVEKNYELAIKYYLMAADAGNVKAMFNLGYYYDKIEKNYELGIKYYSMAVEAGDSNAMCNLGLYYKKIEKNYDLAVKYYLMAIEAGNVLAMFNLGYYYMKVEKNYELGIKYYLMAIETGNVNAMYNLGHYYHTIEKNYELGIKYYLMAIEAGNVLAMNNLGLYYESIEKNYELAVKYYLMAVEKGYMKAINNLNFKNTLKLYNTLVKIVETNDTNKINKELIDKYLTKCLVDSKVKSYANKVRIFKNLNNYHQCAVCLEENVLNIILDCGHEICSECYVNIDA